MEANADNPVSRHRTARRCANSDSYVIAWVAASWHVHSYHDTPRLTTPNSLLACARPGSIVTSPFYGFLTLAWNYSCFNAQILKITRKYVIDVPVTTMTRRTASHDLLRSCDGYDRRPVPKCTAMLMGVSVKCHIRGCIYIWSCSSSKVDGKQCHRMTWIRQRSLCTKYPG